MNILSTSIIVKKVLINVPETRDNDELLMLKVWCIQKPDLRDDKSISFTQFGVMFKNKKLANTESIRRSRQKLQEEIPGLRGKNYKSRKNHTVAVKDQLKDHSMIAGGTP